MSGPVESRVTGWPGAFGLLLVATVTWVGNPGILVAVPLGLLAFLMAPRRPMAMVIGAMALALAVLGNPSSGFWYLERGWALLLGGWFVALSLRWPEERFLPRGMGAVVGAFLGMGLLLAVRPGEWAIVDWLVRNRLDYAVTTFLRAARTGVGADVMTEAFEAQAFEVAALQGMVFPALLGLASLAALGLAWWIFGRLNRRPGAVLGPLKEFRFNDQLVWILILGIIALVMSSGALERLGVNAVVFMGALYALRGAAVVLFLTGGLSIFGGLLFVLGFVFLPPFVVVGAVFIGLGDTWFDLRSRGAVPGSEA